MDALFAGPTAPGADEQRPACGHQGHSKESVWPYRPNGLKAAQAGQIDAASNCDH